MKRMIDNVETLEHLIFKANDIEFADGNVYKLSELLEAKQLVKYIEYCYDNQVPLIIYEYSNDRVWIATSFGDINEVNLSNLGSNLNMVSNLIYDGQDTLSISVENETFLSQDNVKTFFGDQSIIGTGNIDLYRHELNFRGNNNTSTITLTYYSSNKLPVDSAQDLTTITKAVNKTFIACTGFNDQDQNLLGGNGICFENNVWKFGYCYYDQGTAQFNGLFNLEEFHDTVSTI